MSSNTTPIFELSSDSKVLASMLRDAKVGDVVTYDDLSAAIGRDVSCAAAAAMHSARRMLQREDRAIFDAVRCVGLKRLNDAEIVDLSDRARDHLRRTTRRTIKKLQCVAYEALDKAAQTKHNTALSMFGVIGELSTQRSMTRLQGIVTTDEVSIPVGKAAIAALGLIFGTEATPS